ncbi:hypothetical protein JVU11DRAFT_6668 [Chiua virens]|nr:hypothetical protein JVU11DRAFT_6668 [Chiua virens]
MASFVSEIANIPGMTVILTTRTSDVARDVRWTRVEIPKLEKAPARKFFRPVCHREITDDDIDTQLVTVDFHPSSIRALARSAEENRWNGKELLKEWRTGPKELLKSDSNLWG